MWKRRKAVKAEEDINIPIKRRKGRGGRGR